VSSVLNLVHVLCALSKYDEAEVLSGQAIESSRRIPDEMFEIKLNRVSVIAHGLAEQEQYNRAEAMYRRVLVEKERVFGRENECTQGTCYELANLLRRQKRYEEAETIFTTEECLRFEEENKPEP
jgi:hypothetical protein